MVVSFPHNDDVIVLGGGTLASSRHVCLCGIPGSSCGVAPGLAAGFSGLITPKRDLHLAACCFQTLVLQLKTVTEVRGMFQRCLRALHSSLAVEVTSRRALGTSTCPWGDRAV